MNVPIHTILALSDVHAFEPRFEFSKGNKEYFGRGTTAERHKSLRRASQRIPLMRMERKPVASCLALVVFAGHRANHNCLPIGGNKGCARFTKQRLIERLLHERNACLVKRNRNEFWFM